VTYPEHLLNDSFEALIGRVEWELDHPDDFDEKLRESTPHLQTDDAPPADDRWDIDNMVVNVVKTLTDAGIKPNRKNLRKQIVKRLGK